MRLRCILAIGIMLWSGVFAAATPSTPKARVSLVPFSTGIAPGGILEVGVRFELEPGWHIYWQNSGDAGAPPSVAWKVPEGFTTGELEYPIPKKHVSPGDIVTNILKGEPVVLTKIQAPPSIEGNQITLSAKVISFVCAEQCTSEHATVELQVPVANPAEVKPANEEILSRVRRAMPKASSKVVAITPSLSTPQLTPGSKFEIALKTQIAKGYHIQSNKPSLPSLIAAELFLQKVPDVRFERPSFPTPKIRKDKHLGELSEFAGDITVRVPAEIDAQRKPGPIKLAGVFSYQACDDGGNCLPPEAISFSVPVDVTVAMGAAGASVAATNTPTAALPTQSSSEAVVGQTADDVPAQQDLAALQRFGLAGLLLGCFLYGLFINATPCVLPLLSIKVLGFVQQAHESRKRTLVLGLAFGTGVVVFFVILGLLASTGRNILQFPIAVILLGAVVLAMALSMLGVFTLHVPTSATSLEARIQKEGPVASFAKGCLAPVLGFACTGPLLAGIFGWATQQPAQTAILAFAFAGLGMAFPYMLLGANPGWLSFLPRPGMWMITFERVMGFLLLGMVVWLVHPLTDQIGVTGLEWTLVFYVVVAMACWLLGKIQITMPVIQRWKFRLAAASLVLGSSALVYGWVYPLDKAAEQAACARQVVLACVDPGEHISWQPWSPQAVEEAVRAGKLAFVDFTAAYCTVCKVNKKVAIDTPQFVEKLSALGAVAFRADFTDFNQEIADALMKFKGSNLVPLNLIYPPGRPDKPLVLDTNLSAAYLLQKLDEAEAMASKSASLLGSQ